MAEQKIGWGKIIAIGIVVGICSSLFFNILFNSSDNSGRIDELESQVSDLQDQVGDNMVDDLPTQVNSLQTQVNNQQKEINFMDKYLIARFGKDYKENLGWSEAGVSTTSFIYSPYYKNSSFQNITA